MENSTKNDTPHAILTYFPLFTLANSYLQLHKKPCVLFSFLLCYTTSEKSRIHITLLSGWTGTLHL